VTQTEGILDDAFSDWTKRPGWWPGRKRMIKEAIQKQSPLRK
jgi:hypothetical protein